MFRTILIALNLIVLGGYAVVFACHLIECARDDDTSANNWIICSGHGALFLAHLGLLILLVAFKVDSHNGSPPDQAAGGQLTYPVGPKDSPSSGPPSPSMTHPPPGAR